MDRDSQALVGSWLLQTGEIPEGYQEAHLSDEVGEFQHEWNNGRDPERLKGELADIAIAVLGLAAQYEVDLEAEIAAKMITVQEKYPPEAIQFFIDKGYTRGEAMSLLKRGWERQQALLNYG